MKNSTNKENTKLVTKLRKQGYITTHPTRHGTAYTIPSCQMAAIKKLFDLRIPIFSRTGEHKHCENRTDLHMTWGSLKPLFCLFCCLIIVWVLGFLVGLAYVALHFGSCGACFVCVVCAVVH